MSTAQFVDIVRTEPTTEFGRRLRTLRRRQRMTIALLSTITDIHNSTLSMYESGTHQPSKSARDRLMHALHDRTHTLEYAYLQDQLVRLEARRATILRQLREFDR